MPTAQQAAQLFLSTPSARRATLGARPKITSQDISIHALREEGDRAVSWPASLMLVFLSTPSARRATCAMSRGQTWGAFLSTPSARRATVRNLSPPFDNPISIHALREEGDAAPARLDPTTHHFYPRPPRGWRPPLAHRAEPNPAISIHALREEGDAATLTLRAQIENFYPRPPRGGRRRCGRCNSPP